MWTPASVEELVRFGGAQRELGQRRFELGPPSQPREPMKLTVHESEKRQFRDLDDAVLDLEAP